MDLDPQAHASLHLGVSVVDQQVNIYDVLCGDAMIADARRWASPNLAVVPANLDLAAAELELAGEVGREVILRDKLELDDEQFDYLILDCPPSLGVLTLNALTSVDEVFLPLQPHFLALHGLSKLLRTIEIVAKRLNPGLRLSGVVLCMYESSTRLAAEVTRDVEDFLVAQSAGSTVWAGARFFETKIRRNIRRPKRPALVSRSSSTPPLPTERKTTDNSLKSSWRSPMASHSSDASWCLRSIDQHYETSHPTDTSLNPSY